MHWLARLIFFLSGAAALIGHALWYGQ